MLSIRRRVHGLLSPAAIADSHGPGHMVVTSLLGEGPFVVRDPWAGGSTYEVGSDWIGQYVSGGVFR